MSHSKDEASQSSVKFDDTVENVVRCIPERRVTSYGAISIYLTKSKKSAMAVGQSIKRLRGKYGLEEVPVHRVTFVHGDIPNKENAKALEKEGAQIVRKRYKSKPTERFNMSNFTERFWKPE